MKMVMLLSLRTDRLSNFIVEYNQVFERQAAGLYWSCLVFYVSFLLVRYTYQICNSGAYDVIFWHVLGAFAKLRKAPVTFVMSVRPSVRLSACINTVPTGHISVKFNIYDFYENLPRKSKFGYSRAKISDTLYEGLSVFCSCRRH